MNAAKLHVHACVLRARARKATNTEERQVLFTRAAKLSAQAMEAGYFGVDKAERVHSREVRGTSYSLPRWFTRARKNCECQRCGRKGARWYVQSATGLLVRARILHLIRHGYANEAAQIVNAATTVRYCRVCWDEHKEGVRHG